MPHPQSKRAKAAKAKRARERSGASAESKAAAAAHKAAKAEQRQELEEASRVHDRRQRIRNVAIGLAVVAVVGVGLWFGFKPAEELEGVEHLPELGRDHIDNATYSDSAPTSGAHAANSPLCGVASGQLPADLAVHALEHGVVVVWYDAEQPDLGADLVSIMDNWNSHVIISPSSELDASIVATAWNRRKVYTEVSEDLVDFVDIYRNRGPESVACDRQ